MQNRFKFRVWSNLLQKFAVDTEFSHILYQNEDFSNGTFTVGGDDCVIQQFTGYKDKNNIDIYEGDLVKVDKNHPAYILRSIFSDGQAEYTAGEVKWINGGFNICQYYLGRVEMGEFSSCDCHPCALEIIGNIFENPELKSKLKEEDKI